MIAGVNSAVLPLRSLANIGSGVADVIMMPLRGLRSSKRRRRSSGSGGAGGVVPVTVPTGSGGLTSRRSSADVVVGNATSVVRGLSDGLSSFLKAVTLEALRVGVGVSTTTQVLFVICVM